MHLNGSSNAYDQKFKSSFERKFVRPTKDELRIKSREETGRRAEKRNLSPVLFSVCSLSSPTEPRLARLTGKGLLVASGLSVV